MITAIINFTLDNRWLILGFALILVGCGLFSAKQLPVNKRQNVTTPESP
jgi:Cu/Ag efflux pump CusA